MSVLATAALGEAAAQDPAIVVVADSLAVRRRITNALGRDASFVVREAPPDCELPYAVALESMLVHHCANLGSGVLSEFRELKSFRPDLLIVSVWDAADPRSIRRAIDDGVDGLVFADQLETTLVPTLAAVITGQFVVPRDLRRHVPKASLSVREQQILKFVVKGFTNAEIGAQMFLAESTVKSHLSSAYTKLGVRSRSEAIARVIDPENAVLSAMFPIAPGANGELAPGR